MQDGEERVHPLEDEAEIADELVAEQVGRPVGEAPVIVAHRHRLAVELADLLRRLAIVPEHERTEPGEHGADLEVVAVRHVVDEREEEVGVVGVVEQVEVRRALPEARQEATRQERQPVLSARQRQAEELEHVVGPRVLDDRVRPPPEIVRVLGPQQIGPVRRHPVDRVAVEPPALGRVEQPITTVAADGDGALAANGDDPVVALAAIEGEELIAFGKQAGIVVEQRLSGRNEDRFDAR